jgi:hypothetical protein
MPGGNCGVKQQQFGKLDVEWSIGTTLNSSARGLGFEPTPNPISSPFFKTTDLKMNP